MSAVITKPETKDAATLKNELDLRKAAKEGQRQVVQALIVKGVDVNAAPTGKDASEKTALHWAAKYGHADICEDLLSAGARPSLLKKDRDQKTPFDLANLKKNNEAVIQVLLKWSGLKGEDERKKVTDAIAASTDPVKEFNANKVKVAIHNLKKNALTTAQEVKEFYERYSNLITQNKDDIKKRLYKEINGKPLIDPLSETENSKLTAEFFKCFLIDTLVRKHIKLLDSLSKSIELPTYMATYVVSIFVQYLKFKRDLSSFFEKWNNAAKKSLDKTTYKQCKKYLKKLIDIANTDYTNTIKIFEGGLIPLLENPRGFIEFILKYFPGNLIDLTDSHATFEEVGNESHDDEKESYSLAVLKTKLKGLDKLDVIHPLPNLQTLMNQLLQLNSPDQIANATDHLLRKSQIKFNTYKAKTLPCLEAYFKDLREQFLTLLDGKKEAILKYNSLIKNNFGKDPKLIIENFKTYIMAFVDPNIQLALANLRDEKIAIVTYLLRASYLFGYRMYTRIEKMLNKMDTVIEDHIQAIMKEELTQFTNDIERHSSSATSDFETVRQQEKQFAKAKEAAARAAAAEEKIKQEALLFQQSLEEKKLKEESLAKEKYVGELLGRLKVSDSKFLQMIMSILDPKQEKSQATHEMSKADFFALMTKLEIPGFEGIDIKKNTASENSLTFSLGEFYTFTFHSRHGKDRANYVDKANIPHLKKMFEAVGINATTFWSLVKKYAINDKQIDKPAGGMH